MRLGSHDYRISLRGLAVAQGRLQPGRLLVTGQDDTLAMMRGLPSERTYDQAQAVWISKNQQGLAEKLGLQIESAANVLISHLAQTVQLRAADLLTRQATAERLEALRQTAENLITDVIQKLPIGRIQRVLQRLLKEGFSIRDLEAILESLCEAAESTDSLDEQVRAVRLEIFETAQEQQEDNIVASTLF